MCLPACLLADDAAACCRDEVIERIEQLAFELIASAAADGQLPTLSCISTARSNVHMAPRHSSLTTAGGRGSQGFGASRNTQQVFGSASDGTQGPAGQLGEQEWEGSNADTDAAAEADAGDGHSSQQHRQQHVLRLGSKLQTKSLLASGGAQANTIVRSGSVCLAVQARTTAYIVTMQCMFTSSTHAVSLLVPCCWSGCLLTHLAGLCLLAALQLLDSVHALLRSGRSATQRDFYYNVSGGSSSQDGCNRLHERAAALPAQLHPSFCCKHTPMHTGPGGIFLQFSLLAASSGVWLPKIAQGKHVHTHSSSSP